MLRKIAAAVLKRAAKRVERSAMDPAWAQKKALSKLVSKNGSSRVGVNTEFDRITGTEAMRWIAPTSFDSLSAELGDAFRLGRKGRGIFGNSPLSAYKQTSGTTGQPKTIPITRDYLRSYNRSLIRLLASQFETKKRWNQLGRGKILTIASRPQIRVTDDGLPVGYSTGLVCEQLPGFLRGLVLPSSDALRIPAWEERLERILEESENANVTAIAALPRHAIALSEYACATRGVKALRELWPNLGSIVYGGLSLSPVMRERLHEAVGGTEPPSLIEIYAATEGFLGHTYDPKWPGMVFNSLENFYQFREHPEDTRFLQLPDLERGKRYLVYVTTPGGLVNYSMGDWIEVLSTKPLTFRVCAREAQEISLAGEKLTREQAELAIQRACEVTGLRVADYAIWGEERESLRRFVIGVPFEAATAAMGPALDLGLGEVNPIYRLMRDVEGTFDPPEVRALPVDLFRSYFRRNVDRGHFKEKRLFKNEGEFRKEYLA